MVGVSSNNACLGYMHMITAKSPGEGSLGKFIGYYIISRNEGTVESWNVHQLVVNSVSYQHLIFLCIQ